MKILPKAISLTNHDSRSDIAILKAKLLRFYVLHEQIIRQESSQHKQDKPLPCTPLIFNPCYDFPEGNNYNKLQKEPWI